MRKISFFVFTFMLLVLVLVALVFAEVGLEISDIENVVLHPGETRMFHAEVKNLGDVLNNCKLVGGGEATEWISSSQIKQLEKGLSYFDFSISVPEKALGSIGASVFIQCEGARIKKDFLISIIESDLKVSVKSVEQAGNKLRFSYLAENAAVENLNIVVEYSLMEGNEKKNGMKDSFVLYMGEKIERAGESDLANLNGGEYTLVIEFSFGKDSYIALEKIFISKPSLTAKVILGEEGGRFFSIVFMTVVALVVVFFIVRNIIKKTRRLDKAYMIRHGK